MEGIMRTKKRWYFVWMLVFVILVFAGCEKKPVQTDDTDPVSMDGQQHYVKKALKKILGKMKPDGPVSNDKKIQRSLAIHILKDHTALMAYFQSQQWTEMEGVMRNATVYLNAANGVREDGVPNKGFWQKLYDKKKKNVVKKFQLNLRYMQTIYRSKISILERMKMIANRLSFSNSG